MKPRKNKIVFAMLLIGMVLFIITYSILTFGRDKKNQLKPDHIPMPDLEENQQTYKSKIEALDALKEEHETNVPQIYPDHMIDDKGYFNPDYMAYEKQRIIDSIYSSGPLTPSREYSESWEEAPTIPPNTEPKAIKEPISAHPITATELALEHQLFFATHLGKVNSDSTFNILAEVDGKQVLRKNGRIRLRLVEATSMGGRHFPEYTVLYGTVRFQPNRTLLHITHVDHIPVHWEAYDLQDGITGLYMKNSLREEANRAVTDEMTQDINMPGLPQMRGLKSLFQRRQHTQRVTVLDGHRLVLKPKQ